MILNGTSLGERQKQLNSTVNDAVKRNVGFDVIKTQIEESDIDIFFKIDVAAKYKNVDYILEIFKSNDSLHITRAIKKCEWLFDNEYSHIINIEYLTENIWPYMSMKMKRKLLTAISTHIKDDENQAEIFYNYCVDEKFEKTARKFLLHTSEKFKLQYFQKLPEGTRSFIEKNLELFLGNSFILAKAYLEIFDEFIRDELVIQISYLYYVANEKFLDLAEEYCAIYNFYKLSSKISKDIAIKYKTRVLTHLPTYLRILNIKSLVKHSTLDEVKLYAIQKLTKTAEQFWHSEYWKCEKLILQAIPAKERFGFVKQIFENKYPGEKFETSDDFYTSGSYNLMTEEQQVKATENFASEKGKISEIKRNLWYKAVHFNKALSSFQETMKFNKNEQLKINLLMVLIEACKSQENLEKVLTYYHEHSENYNIQEKEKIITTIFDNYKVFDFKGNCWALMQRMLLDKSVLQIHHFSEKTYASFIYLYHILHETEIPEELNSHLDTCKLSSFGRGIKMLRSDSEGKKKLKVFYEHVLQYHLTKLNELEENDYAQARHHVTFVLYLLDAFEKSDNEIPDIVHKFLKLDKYYENKYHKILKDTPKKWLRKLKKDVQTVPEFHAIKDTLKNNLINDNGSIIRLEPLLRRLKIYFSHDVAKDFLNFFKECISVSDVYGYDDHWVIKAAVIGIFMLADEKYKNEMMLKYAPVSSMIDRENMNDFELDIQEAICRFGYYSRPSLPLSSLVIYLDGDYAKLCLPTLGSLFANLPKTQCMLLSKTLLATSIYVVKQSFHLVLHRLSIEDLMGVWRNTESIRLRLNLFTVTYDLVKKSAGQKQKDLLKCFKEMVTDLRENDDIRCFKFLYEFFLIPKSIKYDLVEAAWESVGKFRGSEQLRTTVLNYIDCNMVKMNKEFVRKLVEEHIQNTDDVGAASNFEKSKWNFTIKYLLHSANDEDTNNVSDLIDKVTTRLLVCDWSSAQRLSYFASKLVEKSLKEKRENYSLANSMINKMLLSFLNAKSLETDYLIFWDLKLAILANKLMDIVLSKPKDANREKGKQYSFHFAKEIGELVLELMEKKIYQPFYVPLIASKICKIISNTVLFSESTGECDMHWFNVHLFFVDGLLKFKKVETHLLALYVLCNDFPDELGACEQYFTKLFNEIKTFESDEVQSCLNLKFANNGIKRRRL